MTSGQFSKEKNCEWTLRSVAGWLGAYPFTCIITGYCGPALSSPRGSVGGCQETMKQVRERTGTAGALPTFASPGGILEAAVG